MVLKDWVKSKKYNTRLYTIYSNTLPKYSAFVDNYYIVIGLTGNRVDGVPYVNIVSIDGVKSKTFKKYVDALTFAKKYMRVH